MWYSARVSDPTIASIEAELRESRTQAWDVETFLANRHQAKIEALTSDQSGPWNRRWQAAKEIAWGVAGFVGAFTILYGVALWFLTGRLFLPPFSYGQFPG